MTFITLFTKAFYQCLHKNLALSCGFYSQARSRVNSISKNEMNIRISLRNVRRVNGMLDISLEIVPKKTH